ncbi:MAG: cell division protein ZapA [Clostridiales bacterium]|jgi:cell division protein ZapA|nr:cell division protein ZapA [Clostridiales bacterium]
MSFKKETQVLIGGKVITLSGYESEEYMQKVAMYINSKMNELTAQDGYGKLSRDMVGILLALNVADDLLKLKSEMQNVQLEIDDKDKQLYNLKHDLVDSQIRKDTNASEIIDLEKKIAVLEKIIEEKDSELNEYINTFDK